MRTLLSFPPAIALRMKIVRKGTLKFVDRKVDEQRLMINIGGGYYFRRHWRILDSRSEWYGFIKGAIDYEFDLLSGAPFPFASDSVYLFYSSHSLEHIPQEYCQHIFDEIFRCLRPGGAIRLTMPDFDLACEAFGRNSLDFFVEPRGACIEERFLNFFATYVKERVRPEEVRERFRLMRREDLGDYYTRQVPRESQRKFTGNHINWWTYEKVHRMLDRAGFRDIYRSTPQGSRFSEMRGEGREGGFDSTYPEMSLFVEAVK